MSTDTVYKCRSRLGVATRTGNNEAAREARRDLAAAKLESYIQRTVADAPPLTAEQRARIASLLRPIPSAKDGGQVA